MSATRNLIRTLSFAGLACALVGAAGCGTARDALGFNKAVPDEWRTVAKAPLVVPPDYALRPPSPGEPRPQELQPESAARLALLGQQQSESRSQGETLLVAKAGVSKADPFIRYVVDDEYGSLTHKDKSFADRVMFWKPGDPAIAQVKQQEAVAAPAPLDAKSEDARVKALTGGKPPIIARAPDKKHLKLPGL